MEEGSGGDAPLNGFSYVIRFLFVFFFFFFCIISRKSNVKSYDRILYIYICI